MFYIFLIISCFVALAVSYLVLPFFKNFFITRGIIAIDQQKKEKPIVPQSGGFPVFFGFLCGIFFLLISSLFFIWFYSSTIFVALLSILLVMLVGFFDDINMSKEPVKNIYGDLEIRVGLGQLTKPLLTLLASVPLIIYFANRSMISIPFIGTIDLGFLYFYFLPLFFIVLANSTNMLAGTNGLESGSMFLITLALGAYSIFVGSFEAAALAFISCFALIPFLINNWYPARMLPGDSLTYLFGAVFATVAIVGNIEGFAMVLFIPWAIEVVLKLRGKLKVRSLGDLQEDGTLKKPYDKIYSWTHIMMWIPEWFNKRAKEYQVTLAILGVELFFIILAFVLFL